MSRHFIGQLSPEKATLEEKEVPSRAAQGAQACPILPRVCVGYQHSDGRGEEALRRPGPQWEPQRHFPPPLHPRLRSGAKEGDAGSSSHPQNKDAFGGKKARGSILLPYLLSSEFPQHYSLALEEVIHSRPRNAVSSR